jgi:hypothetical protein
MVALRWDAATGFTKLIDFGDDWAHERHSVLYDVPIATVPGGGYDGQFYAIIALDPVSNHTKIALDNPAYRYRRILLPVIAHVLGRGNQRAILNIYALLNIVAWLVLAGIWWVEVGASTERGALVWLACMLSLGALDSVRLSLTDLPGLLFLILAARALDKKSPWFAALWFLAGGFVRETAVFAAVVFPAGKKVGAGQIWLLRGLAIVPVLAWMAWLHFNLPGDSGVQEIFGWPGLGVAQHLVVCAKEIRSGNFDSRYVFGIIGVMGMAYQSLFLLIRWRASDPWTRLGLPFTVLFWFFSAYVFSGYWAAARAVLPMTFVFNRLVAKERGFWFHFIAGNLFMLHGVWRMLP